MKNFEVVDSIDKIHVLLVDDEAIIRDNLGSLLERNGFEVTRAMDGAEALSNLDAKLRVQMRAELKLLFERVEGTVLYVTHDQAEAMTMSDRVVVMNHGLVQQVGTPMEVYNTPANEFVAGFLGSPPMNFIDVEVSQENDLLQIHFQDAQWQTNLSDPGAAERLVANRSHLSGPLRIGIRPEDFAITAEQTSDSVAGEVILVESMGSMNVVLVAIGEQRIMLTTPPDFQVAGKDLVNIRIAPAKIHFFEPQKGNNVSLLTQKDN